MSTEEALRQTALAAFSRPLAAHDRRVLYLGPGLPARRGGARDPASPTPPEPDPGAVGRAMARRHRFVPVTAADQQNTRRSPIPISLVGQIKEGAWTSAKAVRAALGGAMPFQPVAVTLSSPGGNLHEALAISRALLAHSGKVSIRVIGYAHSAAALVLASGDTRIAGSGARFWFHNTAVPDTYGRRLTATTLREVITPGLANYDETFAAFMAARLGQPAEKIAKTMNRDRDISAREALELNLLTVILP